MPEKNLADGNPADLPTVKKYLETLQKKQLSAIQKHIAKLQPSPTAPPLPPEPTFTPPPLTTESTGLSYAALQSLKKEGGKKRRQHAPLKPIDFSKPQNWHDYIQKRKTHTENLASIAKQDDENPKHAQTIYPYESENKEHPGTKQKDLIEATDDPQTNEDKYYNEITHNRLVTFSNWHAKETPIATDNNHTPLVLTSDGKNGSEIEIVFDKATKQNNSTESVNVSSAIDDITDSTISIMLEETLELMKASGYDKIELEGLEDNPELVVKFIEGAQTLQDRLKTVEGNQINFEFTLDQKTQAAVDNYKKNTSSAKPGQ